jgi:hypothetical protein
VFIIGYTIHYDRAFIRVGDEYVPLVNLGSSNCATAEGLVDKHWEVLNWHRRNRVLFTEAEVREIAREYGLGSAEDQMDFKSRNTPFAPGEFEQWILGGMKRAHTVEEYCSFGNGFYVSAAHALGNGETQWSRHPFSTTEEMLALVEQYNKLPYFDISLANSRKLCLPDRQNAENRSSVVDRMRAWQAQPSQPKTQEKQHKTIGGDGR